MTEVNVDTSFLLAKSAASVLRSILMSILSDIVLQNNMHTCIKIYKVRKSRNESEALAQGD